MSEDNPECAKLHYLKNSFCGNMPPNQLAICFQDQETSNSLKNDTPMTCLNMKLRSCPRVIYELDISVQATRLSLVFLLKMY